MTSRIDSMEITGTLTGDAVVDDAYDNPPRRTPPLWLPDALIAEDDPHLRERLARRNNLRWVNVAVGKTIKLIAVARICYFKADSKYTLVATADSESLIHKPIKELVEELDPDVFWRIHRSTLVKVSAIACVVRDGRGRLAVKLKQRKESLPVSDAYVHLFRQM